MVQKIQLASSLAEHVCCQHEIQHYGAVLKIRAQCRGGELVAELIEQHQAVGAPLEDLLAAIGITTQQAEQWQALAFTPIELLGNYFVECVLSGREVTQAGALRRTGALRAMRPPVATIWKRLLKLQKGITQMGVVMQMHERAVLAERLRHLADDLLASCGSEGGRS